MFGLFKRKREPAYPYELFFYDFDNLGDRPSPGAVATAYPEGGLRLKAFKFLHEKHPDDVRYLWHYLDSYATSGVYDDSDYKHCFTLIERGLSLPDRSDTHAKLRRLRDQLENQWDEVIADLGDDAFEVTGPDELYRLLRSGQHDKLIGMFAEVRHAHQPHGILGGDKDRGYWVLFQMAIQAYFEKQDYRQALSLMEEYESKRISVRLTPIPDYNLQEKVIGCLVQIDAGQAVRKLRFWLANSKIPCICDTIKHHHAFRHLFS